MGWQDWWNVCGKCGPRSVWLLSKGDQGADAQGRSNHSKHRVVFPLVYPTSFQKFAAEGSRAIIYVFNSHHCVFLPIVCPITFWVPVHFAIRPGIWAWCHSVMTLPVVMVLSWPCWLALELGPVLGNFTWGGPEWLSGHGLLVVQGRPCLYCWSWDLGASHLLDGYHGVTWMLCQLPQGL